MKPYLDPLYTHRILDLETVSADVRSVNGGPLGFLIDIFADILIFLFKNQIINVLEQSVQENIDTQIQNMFAGEGAVENTTATAIDVTINESSGIVVNAYAAIDGQSACPTTASSDSNRVRPLDQLKKLRIMRDKVMKNSPRGEAYLRTIKKFNPELSFLILKHKDIHKQMDLLIHSGLQDFSSKFPGQGIMTEATVKEATILFEMVSKVASADLSIVLRGMIPEIQSFVGVPASKIFGKNR